MTGGRGVVLGLAGRNFAAGMSGGLAFVLDREKLFRERCNLEMIALEEGVDKEDVDWVQDILTEFVEKTGSTLAKSVLEDWPASTSLFFKVCFYQCLLPSLLAACLLASMIATPHMHIYSSNYHYLDAVVTMHTHLHTQTHTHLVFEICRPQAAG